MKASKNRITEDELLAIQKKIEKEKRFSSKTASKKESEEVFSKAGLQSINLRLPAEIIEKLKRIAEKDGLKYQPYIRRLLVQHAHSAGISEKTNDLRNEIRQIVREELKLAKTG